MDQTISLTTVILQIVNAKGGPLEHKQPQFV